MQQYHERRLAVANIVVIGGLKMAENSRVDLVCENANRNGQRVSVNLSEQTVTFFNCHQLRSGLGVGFEPETRATLAKNRAIHQIRMWHSDA
jgi:hypothetical protein